MFRLSWYLGALTSWNPHGLPRPLQGFLLLGQNPSLSVSVFLAPSTVRSFVQMFLLADLFFSVTRSTISLLWANCWIDCLELRVNSHYSGDGRGGKVINRAGGTHRDSVRCGVEIGLRASCLVISRLTIQHRLLPVENYSAMWHYLLNEIRTVLGSYAA